jgi:hypothetical protein
MNKKELVLVMCYNIIMGSTVFGASWAKTIMTTGLNKKTKEAQAAICSVDITRNEALKIIRSNNLVKVKVNDLGVIYDTKENSFQNACKELGIKECDDMGRVTSKK